MTESILFVCAQNICRSPLMAAAFSDALGAADGLDLEETNGAEGTESVEWEIHSAGTLATDGRRVCRYASRIVTTAVGHRSSRLEAEDLDRAGLVIAASLEERALIVRLLPQARSRTFTLREALLLGEQPIAAESLAEYAAQLDSRRGTLDLPVRRALPWRRQPVSPLDVADVHHLGVGAHKKGLQNAVVDVELLATHLSGRIATRVSAV